MGLIPEITVLVLSIIFCVVGRDVFTFGDCLGFCAATVFLTFLLHMWILVKMDPEQQKKDDARKYNNYRYTCPMCRSNRIKTIGSGKKMITIGAVGVASSDFGKNYQCDSCNYKW